MIQSPAAQLVYDRLHGEVGELNNEILKRIIFFIKEKLGIESFRLKIQSGKGKKVVWIEPYFKETGKVYYCWPKDPNTFAMLEKFLGLTEYKIRFVERKRTKNGTDRI